jgi:hypothetical protein
MRKASGASRRYPPGRIGPGCVRSDRRRDRAPPQWMPAAHVAACLAGQKTCERISILRAENSIGLGQRSRLRPRPRGPSPAVWRRARTTAAAPALRSSSCAHTLIATGDERLASRSQRSSTKADCSVQVGGFDGVTAKSACVHGSRWRVEPKHPAFGASACSAFLGRAHLTLMRASRILHNQPRGAPPQGAERPSGPHCGGTVTLEPEPGHAGGGTGAGRDRYTPHPLCSAPAKSA